MTVTALKAITSCVRRHCIQYVHVMSAVLSVLLLWGATIWHACDFSGRGSTALLLLKGATI